MKHIVCYDKSCNNPVMGEMQYCKDCQSRIYGGSEKSIESIQKRLREMAAEVGPSQEQMVKQSLF